MHLTLHLTRACNMRCRYCYAPPYDAPGMTEQVGRAAMELGARINKGSCGIVFFGGEPLLEKQLLQSLVLFGRDARRRQEALYHFKITTNGLLLDEAFLEFAEREDVMIAMSFDGVCPAHDAHRHLPNGAGSFDRLLPKLKLLLHAKPYSSIIMVVNPDTAAYMAEGVSMLMDMGVRYLILSLNYAGNWEEEHLEVLRRQYQQLARRYVQWTRLGRKFYLSPFEVKLSSHINRECFDEERCDLGARQLSVDPAGYLYPCVQFVKAGPGSRWCIGDVRAGIDADKFGLARQESHQEKPTCVGCELNRRCAHTCSCLNWQTTGKITEVSPVLCEHEKMLIGIADRLGNILYRRQEPVFIRKHYSRAYPLLSLLEDDRTLSMGREGR